MSEKAKNILTEQTNFNLSPEKWEEFCKILDRPAQDKPGLKKLLTEPDVFE